VRNIAMQLDSIGRPLYAEGVSAAKIISIGEFIEVVIAIDTKINHDAAITEL